MAVMAIDWGRKRMGFAYMTQEHNIIFPLGSLDNDADVLYNIAHLVGQHRIQNVLIGYPQKQQDVQQKIDTFMTQLGFVLPPDIVMTKVNEDYSSVQANAVTGTFAKTPEEDSLAAMVLLEEWQKKHQD